MNPEPDPVESIMASLFELDVAELSAAVDRACQEHPELADEIRARLHAVRFVFAPQARRSPPPAQESQIANLKLQKTSLSASLPTTSAR